MKKSIMICLAIIMVAITAKAQKITNQKWHNYYVGGNKGYYVKTYQFTTTKMTENQFGSGGQFDNKPNNFKVAELVNVNDVVKVIADYGESNYYVIIFKNITNLKADVCFHTEAFKTMDEAKAYEPNAIEFQPWFTEPGYVAENKKPIMPPLTKEQTIELTKYMTKDIKAQLDKAKTEEEKFGIIMTMAVLPSFYAESKGFHPYKSLPIMNKAMDKYANDPTIKKMMKDAGIDE